MAYTNINKSSDYFNTKLFTGTGSTLSITGVGFAPDLTWVKRRSSDRGHTLCDQVRGDGYNLYPDLNFAQAFATSTFTSLDSDGFTLGADDRVNQSSGTHVSWNWLGGGTGVSNTDGDVTSTVSANQTSGFSIVKYTNPSSGSPFTVGHGLGSVPKMIIIKNLSSAQNWGVYHTGTGFGYYSQLNSDINATSANLVTATSSTTFSTYQDHHSTGNELIAYCFAEVKGFSKIGKYYGNQNPDGVFQYCGFKPAFLLVKQTNDPNYTGDDWFIWDNKRNGYNVDNDYLRVNSISQEGDSTANSREVDFVSNGFKLRDGAGGSPINGNSDSYIYYAVAEQPLVGTNGVPATAR